ASTPRARRITVRGAREKRAPTPRAGKPFVRKTHGTISPTSTPVTMATTTALAELQRNLEAGLSMHRLGKLGLAESHYARVVKIDPAQTEAWHLLGVVAFQAGNAGKAIKHYRKAVELRPGFAQALNNLAIAHKARGQAAV